MTHLHPLATAVVQDVERIRAAFPALDRRQGGAPVAYFDGPGGTQVPGVVADAVTDYLLHHNANTHWHYPTSEETDAALAGAREWLAALLGASADEVAFGANMTSLTFHVAGRSGVHGGRATKSLSRSSIITPTWRPGRRWLAIAA